VKGSIREQLGNLQIDFKSHNVAIDGERVDLTPKEFRILCFLVEHLNEVISRERILNVIWGAGIHVTDRVIDNHITALRKKLSKSDVKIESIYSEGYKITFHHK